MGPLPPGPDRAGAEPKRVNLSPKLQVGSLYRYNLDKIGVVWKLEDTFISLYLVLKLTAYSLSSSPPRSIEIKLD